MHVWQHILHRLFLTSVALIDEVPDALNWLEYIYELWLAQHPKMGRRMVHGLMEPDMYV